MPFDIIRVSEAEPSRPIRLVHRTYLDAEGRATTDPALGVELLGITGDTITSDQAARHHVTAKGVPRRRRTRIVP